MITKDNIESLIEFGGLIVYRVTLFNHLLWKDEVICNTFNEEYAKEVFYRHERNSDIVKIETMMVHFNYNEEAK